MMMNVETWIPSAYFITFTCYGAWLHGEKSTSVDRFHNQPGTDFLTKNTKRAGFVKTSMNEKPYLLDEVRRHLVLKAIKNVCAYQQWTLLAVHVRTNHVHVVVHATVEAGKIMNALKAYASRALNDANLDKDRRQRWTRHGSTRYLWKEEEIEATIQYVIHEQGEPMACFENKKRVFLTDI
jgi:REP element-mobilizing transposase RayT